jgi:CRISPR-associated protein (TIGR02710 family)
VIFVVSRASKSIVPAIEHAVQSGGYPDFRGRWESVELDDHQDIRKIFQQLRRLFQDRVAPLSAQGWNIIIDFTGGTKAMSAATVTTAVSFGNCRLSYVGGGDRSEGGLGVVVSGAETIIKSYDPWETLGHRALEEADGLLRIHAFAAATAVLRQAIRFISDMGLKDTLNAVATLAEALSDWDSFKFADAKEKLKKSERHQLHLESAFGLPRARPVMEEVAKLKAHISFIISGSTQGGPGLTRVLILDLLANAKRRFDEGRWDDTTARLYRVIEAIAQLQLQQFGLKTNAIPIENVPAILQAKWMRSAENGLVKLGLQDAWELLDELKDPVAQIFMQTFPDPKKSPLTARNNSILAHGFNPVSQSTAQQLLEAAKKLIVVVDIDPIFRWPRSPVIA